MHANHAQIQSLVHLKNRKDFLKINRQGRKWAAHGLILQALPNDLGQKRVGYTVSKKADKSAVRRNRIKRRLRAAAAEILPGRAKDSHDYVLIGRRQAAIRPYETLKGDLEYCLKKLECHIEKH